MLMAIAANESQNDRRLAEQLYLQYSQPMFRIASTMLKNDTRAEDAVAEAFERIIRNLRQFSGLSSNQTRGLIVTYTRNVCISLLRRDHILEFSQLDVEDIPGDFLLEEFVSSRTAYRELMDLIASLDDAYQDVLRLKYFSGLSSAEAAAALDISPENARIRLHRARAELRKRLKEAIKDEQ